MSISQCIYGALMEAADECNCQEIHIKYIRNNKAAIGALVFRKALAALGKSIRPADTKLFVWHKHKGKMFLYAGVSSGISHDIEFQEYTAS